MRDEAPEDSVELFFDHFRIKKRGFISWGIEKSKFAEPETALDSWHKLVEDIQTGKEKIYVRRFGRSKAKQKELRHFYEKVLGIKSKTLHEDKTNNYQPYKRFSEAMGMKKKKDLLNYKVSHIFGKTKNPYDFCAVWNMSYTPVVIDPFTGHEVKSTVCDDFMKRFQNHALHRFGKPISEFNRRMCGLRPKINKFIVRLDKNRQLTEKDKKELKESIKENFSKIKRLK